MTAPIDWADWRERLEEILDAADGRKQQQTIKALDRLYDEPHAITRAELDQARAELAEERMRRQALATVVELAISGLQSGLAHAAGDPIADIAEDAFTLPDPPIGAAEDAVCVPVWNLPMRRDTPVNTSAPADAAAGADRKAPTQ